jgi:hypothetical protein
MNSAAANDGSGGLLLVLLEVGLVYFLPSIIAIRRGVPDRGSVVVINLFFGWTFVGWVSALVMAARSRAVPVQVIMQHEAVRMPSYAPGWYPEPNGYAGIERFWDGAAWTPATREVQGRIA